MSNVYVTAIGSHTLSAECIATMIEKRVKRVKYLPACTALVGKWVAMKFNSEPQSTFPNGFVRSAFLLGEETNEPHDFRLEWGWDTTRGWRGYKIVDVKKFQPMIITTIAQGSRPYRLPEGAEARKVQRAPF
jgi:hypothetical protein